ncbi:MAG: D-glycerate dehydrogenase [Candidatus Bathyarchaeia archaeon]
MGETPADYSAMRPKVYVTRLIPEEALKKLAENVDYHIWEGELPIPRDVLLREVAPVDALLSLLTDKVDGPIMDAAPKLRVISNMAVRFDNIDAREATKRRIMVCNTPGVLTETTADFAFALLLAAARRVVEGDRVVRAGKWKTWGPMILLGQDMHHATLGIIGLGRIGAEVAKRAKGFDMRIIYYDTTRRPDMEKKLGVEFRELENLLAESDFVTVHCPLVRETHHLIGDEQFKIMKKTAILVNTARGQIVDPRALYSALRDRQIAYAALDVTEPEPLPMNDPLLTLDNIVITPHIASASVATRTKMAMMAVDNLLAGIKGERPPYIVNPEVLT